jgi:pimeloyl-ACP methyl ester carboxylesterase
MMTNPPTYWFFIRGLMRESAHWEDFPSKFEAAFPNHKVVMLDLPGSGKNWKMKCPLTVVEMAESIRIQGKAHLTRESQLSGKSPNCFVLAISLGGMVALEWIQRFSNELKGGVFINISLSGLNPFYHRLKPRAWIPLMNIVLTRDVQRRERKVLELTTSQFAVQEQSLKQRVMAYQNHPATKTNFVRQLVAASRFRPNLSQVTPPILLLNSLGDRLVDSACSSTIQSKWNWDLKTHPTANHDLPLEDPQWVISQIQEWMKKQKL